MKRLAHWLGSAIAIVTLALSVSSKPVFADSYTIVALGDDSGRGIYGIDTTGDVVIWGGNSCGQMAYTCYTTYDNGIAISDTSTAPTLAYDDGTSCGSTPAGYNASKIVCNNGWIGLGALYNPNGDPNGVYIGLGSDINMMQSGSADQVFLNSVGDLAWTDGQSEEMYEAIDNSTTAQTPEPRSLLLIGTGFFLFFAALRRKANRRPSLYID
jgi:hypothetical protein